MLPEGSGNGDEMTIQEEIRALKESRDAVILAHYYVEPEVQELADYVGDSFYLSGRALHKKKNHMNYFLKTYDYTVKDITPDMTEEVMSFVTSHKIEKDAEGEELESLHAEEDAIRRYLAHTEEEDVYSVAIYIGGELVAIALGERLNHNTAAEHFEKAEDDYRGLYQVICSEFCKRLPEEIVYVIREEDMGLENLRKAKEALRPDHKEVKYGGCFFSSNEIE